MEPLFTWGDDGSFSFDSLMLEGDIEKMMTVYTDHDSKRPAAAT